MVSKLRAAWWILRGHSVVYRVGLSGPLELPSESARLLITEAWGDVGGTLLGGR